MAEIIGNTTCGHNEEAFDSDAILESCKNAFRFRDSFQETDEAINSIICPACGAGAYYSVDDRAIYLCEHYYNALQNHWSVIVKPCDPLDDFGRACATKIIKASALEISIRRRFGNPQEIFGAPGPAIIL